ncbi:MAG: hypothetical protein HOO88_04415 [Kiritimatiellaceae bacterium]|nr:hypothetical protein [Kiritimatiellaceae bacterium]
MPTKQIKKATPKKKSLPTKRLNNKQASSTTIESKKLATKKPRTRQEKPVQKKQASSITIESKKSATKKPRTRQEKPVQKKPVFKDEIDSFVSHIESLSKALGPTMQAMGDSCKKTTEEMDSFIKKRSVQRTTEDGTEAFEIKPADFHQFSKKIKKITSASLAVFNIPPIFLCALVHKYDAYLGRLLRVAFSVKPDILASSQKTLTYTDLASFGSLEAARDSLIEKEVESVLRDSHSDHFKWMEERFALPLRKGLKIWPQFVEITERRNLFVHCDGIVSTQYLRVCRQHGVELDKNIKVGDQLHVTPDYFSKTSDCFLEIGIKLGHVLWRKLQPDDMAEADDALHSTGFDLLSEERYDLAKIILLFSTDTLKNVSSDQIRRVNLINLCIAHKFSGDEKKCQETLDSEDWSSCSPELRMAVAVLKDKFDHASSLMESMGAKGPVNREDYSTWPLFKFFRESKEFLETYRKLFGEKFILTEENLPT